MITQTCCHLRQHATTKPLLHFNFKYMYYQLNIYYIVAVDNCCWLGVRKSIRPVKKLSGGVLAWLSLERGADLHMAQMMPLPITLSCFNKSQVGFTFLIPAHLSSPGQRAVKWLFVVVVVVVDKSQLTG